MPSIDPHQDWFLLSGTQQDGFTTLTYTRLLNTRDCEHDLPITSDTLRLIWAFNNQDPADENSILYHGNMNRGAKSVNLLEPVQDKMSLIPSSAMSVSFLNPAVRVPSARTTYWCQGFNMPSVTARSHVIKFGPVIPPVNKGVVHHMVLTACYAPISESLNGEGYTCYTNSMPPELKDCHHPIAVWAVGGDDFYYPENVGFSIGGPGDPTFVILETHYDNPQGKADIIDNSGLRMWYTPELRQYDAGVIEVGTSVYEPMMIPPQQPSFQVRGYCASNCTDEALPPTGIKAFAYMLHTHLLGRKVQMSQYRASQLVGELGRDDQYDFNYQQTRLLSEEKTILPGDTIVVDCFYDSTSRTKPTFGGLATTQEMCLSWVYYYPRTPMAFCESVVLPAFQFPLLGLGNVPVNYGNEFAPNYWGNYFVDATWTPALANGLQQIQTNADPYLKCRNADHTSLQVSKQTIPNPTFVHNLPDRSQDCLTTPATTPSPPTAPPMPITKPITSFMHSISMDEDNKYTLSWSFNDTSITFEVRVKTTGWVGFGISPNGGMTGADIVIGWVDASGRAFFTDRHATGFMQPLIDARQDWFLTYANKQSGFTILQFTRLLDTRDCEHDLPITSDTLKLIWAFNDLSPADENSVVYHGAVNRGAKSVNLLEPVQDKMSLIPSSAMSVSFINPNVQVPSAKTTYWCQGFNMPSVTTKNHVIKFGPVIPAVNKGVVHHMVVYACYAPISESMHGAGYTCYTDAMPPELADCRHPIAVWAVGGDDFYYPENVGFSIGGPGDPTFVILETHYDNPQGKPDIIDNSGMRIWFTPDLRQYDAGVVEVGSAVFDAMMIPPKQPSFHIRGICSSNCTEEALPATGIKAFAYMLHTHLLGRKVQMSQYRGSQLVGELGRDDQYDFNYQQTRLLSEEKTIMPGDTVVVDCFYDSTGRDKPTFGGLATTQEMCLSWLYYYPRTQIAFCQSAVLPAFQFPLLGLGSMPVDYWNEHSPDFWLDYFIAATWTPALVNGIQQIQTKADPFLKCQKTDHSSLQVSWQTVPYPTFVHNLPDRSQDCLTTPVTPSSPPTPPPMPIPKPITSFMHSISMDEGNKYTLSWTFNDTSITFEVRVKTAGWVGFGISPNGGMTGADIVIGWVGANGQAFFKDRHATGFERPLIDDHQDWFLTYANKQSGFTILQFTRLLNTHDCEHDLPITADTLRLIWAFSDQIPSDDNSVLYHGNQNRGAKSVNLLEPVQDKSSLIPDSAKTYSFINPAVRVPSAKTTYWCQGFNMPSVTSKNHVIKFGPVIPPENKGVVHHMVLYACYAPINESMHGEGYTCYTNAMPPELADCRHPIAVWAVGGEDFYYPDNVGFPIGGPGDPTFAILETHYDNPEGKADITDNSGLRIWYTPALRQYDAGVMEAGHAVIESLMIPPKQSSFHIRGFCASDCTEEALPPTGIKAFAYMLHTHLLGRKVQMSQYRGSQLVGALGRDDQYDFNYQQTRLITGEKTIMPGDTIVVDCFYDSTGRDNPTFGGLATTQEMCLSWIYYYPRTPMAFCQSLVLPTDQFALLGLGGVPVEYFDEHSPNFWVDYFIAATWTPALVHGLQQLETQADPLLKCLKTDHHPFDASWKTISYPTFVQSLPDRNQDCLATTMPATTTPLMSTVKPMTGFMHSISMDEANKYGLSWSFNDTSITFEVRVKTTGWVGFGISPNGGMTGGDIVTGWIDASGQAFFTDRHATGFSRPVIDARQDWFLTYANKQSGFTVLQFTRLLDTRDCDHDLPITPDTLRLIWAYNDQIPSSETTVPYHGTSTRGTKSVNLLEPVQDKSSLIPPSAMPVDFLNPAVAVPSDRTTYWCQGFSLPAPAQRGQIIKVSPVIQPENRGIAHHMALLACYAPIDHSLAGTGYSCYTDAMPPAFADCRHPIAIWAIGGGDFYYPEDVGFSIGGPGDPTFVVLETHYDNPEGRADIVDSSGLKLWFTPQPRRYDAGVLQVGHGRFESMLIPPGQPSFRIQGVCTSNCTQEAIPSGGLKSFAFMLHTHLLGRKVHMKQYRESQFIGELGRDDHYDFNYQQTRMFKEEKTILPGDTIAIDCYYDSTSRNKSTFGGPSTFNEMCVTWLYYYPRTQFSFCESLVHPQEQLALLGLGNVTDNFDDEHAPNYWAGYFENVTWTAALADGIQQLQANSDLWVTCKKPDSTTFAVSGQKLPYPTFVAPLKDREQDCFDATKTSPKTTSMAAGNSSLSVGVGVTDPTGSSATLSTSLFAVTISLWFTRALLRRHV